MDKQLYKILGNTCRRSSVKKVFLKSSQNSQESTYVGVSFLIKLQAQSWGEFLRTFFLIEHFRLLLLESLIKVPVNSFLSSFTWSMITARKNFLPNTAQKAIISTRDFFSRCNQILGKLRIWSHLLKKFLMENFVFCAVVILFMALCNISKTKYILLL